MGEEMDRQPSYEERRLAAKQHASEVMGDATPAKFMEAAQDHTFADEYRDLVEWYTDFYDGVMIALYEDGWEGPDAALPSVVRQKVRAAEPEKFARLRELERINERQAHTHRHVVSAGHAAATEQTLESKGWLT